MTAAVAVLARLTAATRHMDAVYAAADGPPTLDRVLRAADSINLALAELATARTAAKGGTLPFWVIDDLDLAERDVLQAQQSIERVRNALAALGASDMTEREAMDFLIEASTRGAIAVSTDRHAASLFDGPVPSSVKFYDPAEPADMIVCRPCDDDHPLLLLDNEIADCGACGRRVQFRPHCLPGPKTCVFCAVDSIKAEAAQ